jgi:hypothetical protein
MLTFHFPKLGFFTRRDTWDAGKVGKIKIRLLHRRDSQVFARLGCI